MPLSAAITGDPVVKPTKSLAVNGVWQVPVEERPSNWKSLKLKEPVAEPEAAAAAVIFSESVKLETPKRDLAREELYGQVWTKPMRLLAKEYGISDVALAKRCRKLSIPMPGRGYWAKLAVGQKIEQTPLPPVEAKTEDLPPAVDLPPIKIEPIKPIAKSEPKSITKGMTKICQIPVEPLCSDALDVIEVFVDDKRTILRVWNPLRKEFAEFYGVHVPKAGEPE